MRGDAVFEHLACLRGQPRTTVRLDGGLTNRNFRVTTEERDVVVRLSSTEDSAVLAIDRDAEYASSPGGGGRCRSAGGRVRP